MLNLSINSLFEFISKYVVMTLLKFNFLNHAKRRDKRWLLSWTFAVKWSEMARLQLKTRNLTRFCTRLFVNSRFYSQIHGAINTPRQNECPACRWVTTPRYADCSKIALICIKSSLSSCHVTPPDELDEGVFTSGLGSDTDTLPAMRFTRYRPDMDATWITQLVDRDVYLATLTRNEGFQIAPPSVQHGGFLLAWSPGSSIWAERTIYVGNFRTFDTDGDSQDIFNIRYA